MRTRRGLLATGVVGLAGCSSILPDGDQGAQEERECIDAGTADARLGFVGDVMLGRSVNERWRGEGPGGVWGSTLDRLQTLDGLLANLECCISDRGERWPEKTYYFRADPSFAVPALEAADVSFASLANNHILDFREQALRDTRDHLDDAGIAHAGAGPDRETALEPTVFEAGGLTVGAFGLTDQASNFAAGESSAGTAFVRLDRTSSTTRVLVEDAIDEVAEHDPDLVVASLHWGPNWETEPSGTHERFARWLVDAGVDVVHGHSAHVLQGVEVYQGRPIIYDAGDFVDDYVDYIDREGVHNKRSALFELVVTDGELDVLRIVPLEIVDESAQLAGEEVTDWVLETMRDRSDPYETSTERVDGELSVSLGTC